MNEKVTRNDINPGIIVMFCGFAGIIVAFIEKVLYDNGTIIDEFITGTITITDLMALTIIIWILVGIIIGVAKS